ncbi:MAG: hypothetical protein ACTSRU_20085 [Candidatus Hodarchaeales archaeon]
MYKLAECDKCVHHNNGVDITPVVITLEDEHGGRIQVGVDDHAICVTKAKLMEHMFNNSHF